MSRNPLIKFRMPLSENDFISLVSQQLRHIFPYVKEHEQLETKTIPSMVIDIVARSANGRLLLFETKYMPIGRVLTYSAYPAVASLKEAAASIAPEAPPIVVLLTNGKVDESVREVFAKSGIPIVIPGADINETQHRLQSSFEEFAIDLPEVTSGEQPSVPLHEICFVAMPLGREQNLVFEEAILPAIKRAGYLPIRPEETTITSDVYESLKRSRTIIADLTNSSPNVFYELGLAHSLGKNVILISDREEDISFHLKMERVLQYDKSPAGINRLRSALTELLVTDRKRQSVE
jgi:hypothetical protein